MAKHLFPKAAPLSPRSNAYFEDGNYYRDFKGRKTKVSGVPTTENIYFWWFQYLRCSDKYLNSCLKNGKGMQRLYDDFGDIFAYADTPQGFWQWWIHKEGGADELRGEHLFGIRAKPQAEMQDWVSLDDLDSIKAELQKGSIKLLAVPTNLNKNIVTRRFQKLLKPLKETPKKTELAKYQVKSVKVDALSLEKALTVWKMKFVQKMSHAEIAYELEQNPRYAKRQIKIGRDYERSEYSDPRNTVIVRLWKKAQKNIDAVERGEFGFGH